MPEPSEVEKIVEQWEQDAKIDPIDIKGASLSTPLLHAKYIRLLAIWKSRKTQLRVKLNEQRQLKTDYYNGRLSLDQCKALGLHQYQGNRPLKSELEALLSSDPDVNKVLIQTEAVETIVDVLEAILTQIKARDFEISNYIKMQIFEAGGN